MQSNGKTLVLVCQNVDCMSRGGKQVILELQQALAAEDGIEVRPYMCFGACHEGPNIVVYPRRQWYSGVKLSDVPEIVEAIKNGKRVERLCDQIDQGSRDFIYNLLDAGIY